MPERGAPSRACLRASRCLEVCPSSRRNFSKYGNTPREGILPGPSPEPGEVPGFLPSSLCGPKGPGESRKLPPSRVYGRCPIRADPPERAGDPSKGVPGWSPPGKAALAPARKVAEGRARALRNRLGEGHTVVVCPSGWLDQRASQGRKTGPKRSKALQNLCFWSPGAPRAAFPSSLRAIEEGGDRGDSPRRVTVRGPRR